MIIRTLKFTLQPESEAEMTALADAMDAAIDHDATAATAELQGVRNSRGGLGHWRMEGGEFVAVEISPAALQLVSMALVMFAEWADEPDYQVDPRGLTSTQLRELAGTVDAWLVTV